MFEEEYPVSDEDNCMDSGDGGVDFEQLRKVMQQGCNAVENCDSSEAPPPTETQVFIESLQCHCNWIKTACLRDRDFARIGRRNEQWIADTRDDPLMAYYKAVTQRLIKALCEYLGGGWSDALTCIRQALIDVEQKYALNEIGLEHYNAYKYILHANRLVVLFKSDMTMADESLTLVQNYESIRSKKGSSLLLILKAVHLRWFNADCVNEYQDLIEKAMEIDPSEAAYALELCSLIRRSRRERDFLSVPTEKELELIHIARQTAPDSPTVLRHWGTFYHDAIKATVNNSTNQEASLLIDHLGGMAEVVQIMIDCAKEAFDKNPESLSAAIRYAEFLEVGPSGRRDETADLLEARKQFEWCIERWPNNSEVLHKVGKFTMFKDDFHKGMAYLRKAVECNPQNFPCLMDIVRYTFKREREQCIPDILLLIEEQADTLVQRPVLFKKLSILRGTLLASDNKFEEALECWVKGLDVPKNSREIHNDDLRVLVGLRTPGLCNNLLQIKTLLKHIEKEILDATTNGNDSRLQTLQCISEVFLERMNKAKRNQSEADRDDDWRSSSSESNFGTPGSSRERPSLPFNSMENNSANDGYWRRHYRYQSDAPEWWNQNRSGSSYPRMNSVGYNSNGNSRYYSTTGNGNEFRRNAIHGNWNVRHTGAHRVHSISDADSNWRRPN